MSESLKQSLLSVARTLLGFGAGALVARGLITEVEALELVGAAMLVIPLVFGVLNKTKAEAKTQARETIAVQAGVDAKAEGMVARTVTPERAQTLIKTMAP